MTFSIDIKAPAGSRIVKPWFPYPTSSSCQAIEDLEFSGNHSNFSFAREPVSGALYIYTGWNGPMYAEVDGRPLDYCRPKSFRYAIRFREG